MSIILRRQTNRIASAIAQIKSTQCHHRLRHIPVWCLSQKAVHSMCLNRNYCTPPRTDPLGSALLDLVIYEAVCSDTLEGLCGYFDDVVESKTQLLSADVNYSVRINITVIVIPLVHQLIFFSFWNIGRSFNRKFWRLSWHVRN